MSIHVVHYLDGTSEEFPPMEDYVRSSGMSWSGPTYMGGGPGPGGGGVVKFEWRIYGGPDSNITIPLMRVHHIEERHATQEDYDRWLPA